MKVVLTRDVKGVGKANEVKAVSEGYARNYLLPRGLAIPATKEAITAAERHVMDSQKREERLRAESERVAEKLRVVPLVFQVKAGETGRLYGSITNKDIAQAISKVLGAPFDRRQIILEHPIRDIGIHLVDLKLAGNVAAQVRLVVEAEA
ncbi:MAG: 50S ribosomal protein L9 [Anaerolineae bacterium]|nr:50S ribosomal protein L9 [Anaerolineae bacterium]